MLHALGCTRQTSQALRRGVLLKRGQAGPAETWFFGRIGSVALYGSQAVAKLSGTWAASQAPLRPSKRVLDTPYHLGVGPGGVLTVVKPPHGSVDVLARSRVIHPLYPWNNRLRVAKWRTIRLSSYGTWRTSAWHDDKAAWHKSLQKRKRTERRLRSRTCKQFCTRTFVTCQALPTENAFGCLCLVPQVKFFPLAIKPCLGAPNKANSPVKKASPIANGPKISH